jgi:asparagine synthase (glutamine-hydrolysing)
MCGIIGILKRKETNVAIEDLEVMLDKIKHRGPDSKGIYIHENLGLGHTRLSIIDTSHLADQPFYYKDQLVLVFNGAIYNFIELKEELTALGYSFTTSSDTEVLLFSYLHWGEDCVKKFNGMWAFAIHDKYKNKLFCSRDHFGIKPFFYSLDDDTFIFSSEIKPILCIKEIKKANLKAVLHYLTFKNSDYRNQSFFENIVKLEPSHNLSFDLVKNEVSIYKYYEIAFMEEISKLSLEDTTAIIDAEFKRAIKIRLRSDLKIGSSLSGGLDSSYIAKEVFLNQKENKSLQDFTTVTVGSLNQKNDETHYAKIVAEKLNINNTTITPSQDDFKDLLENVIYSQEEPFAGKSVHMQNFLMREVNRLGIKVLLSGQGADEVFLGYNFYISAYFNKTSFLEYIKFIYELRKNNKISFFVLLKSNLYYSKFVSRIDFITIKEITNSFNNFFELQKNEIFVNSLPEMLKWEDKNAMAYGVESRLPYLDHKLVELCLSINPKYKIAKGWTKYIIRKNIEHDLPQEIVWRKNKIGFEPPFEEWWPTEQKIIDKINNSPIIQELFDKKFKKFTDREFEWRLYNLAIWEEQYGMHL